MRQKALFIVTLFLLLLPFNIQGQRRSVTKGLESTYFGNYKPKEPRSLNELPVNIRLKVENHLKARLGDVFYSQLKLSGGQIIDFDELYRVEPDARNYKWKIFAYGLNFMFAEPKKGIKSYHARILLDAEGNVLREIDLPEIAKYPEKANIISLAEARQVATKHGFPRNRADVSISYDSDIDSLVWTLEYKLRGDRYVWVDRTIRIDAHSGKVLSIGEAERFY